MKTTLLEKLKKEGLIEQVEEIDIEMFWLYSIGSVIVNSLCGWLLAYSWGNFLLPFILGSALIISLNYAIISDTFSLSNTIWQFKKEVR